MFKMTDPIIIENIYNYCVALGLVSQEQDIIKIAVEVKSGIVSGIIYDHEIPNMSLKLNNNIITQEQFNKIYKILSERVDKIKLLINDKIENNRQQYVFVQKVFDQLTGQTYKLWADNQFEAQKQAGKDQILPPCSVCARNNHWGNKNGCSFETEYNCSKYTLSPQNSSGLLNAIINL